MAEGIKDQKLLSDAIAKNNEQIKKDTGDIAQLFDDLINLSKNFHGNQKIGGRFVRDMRKDLSAIIDLRIADKLILEDTNKVLQDNEFEIETTLDMADKLGDKIKDSVESIPIIGDMLSDKLKLDDLGENIQKQVMDNLVKGVSEGFQKGSGEGFQGFFKSFDGIKNIIGRNIIGPISKMGTTGKAAAAILRRAMTMAFGPVGIAIAAFAAIFTIVKKIRKAQREFGQAVGISRDQVGALAIKTKAVEKGFNAIGLDGSQIQGTLKEIVSEFGSLENMTVSNAANIERFAQNAGVSSSEVVKLNKVFMDLDGLSFDAATNVSKTAASLAKAAGVSTNKVIGDMSNSAAEFAKFSMDGAEGFAKAAVEAAKVGSSLTGILSAADKLLEFENSITAQFEAQVLTGKMINTERARQLALDGDIAGLTSEIQSIVGGVGDIQSLNVIQRKSVADAIGISVSDLLKISRGEQAESQKTVQDYQKETNAILSDIAGYTKDTADKDNKVEMITPAF